MDPHHSAMHGLMPQRLETHYQYPLYQNTPQQFDATYSMTMNGPLPFPGGQLPPETTTLPLDSDFVSVPPSTITGEAQAYLNYSPATLQYDSVALCYEMGHQAAVGVADGHFLAHAPVTGPMDYAEENPCVTRACPAEYCGLDGILNECTIEMPPVPRPITTANYPPPISLLARQDYPVIDPNDNAGYTSLPQETQQVLRNRSKANNSVQKTIVNQAPMRGAMSPSREIKVNSSSKETADTVKLKQSIRECVIIVDVICKFGNCGKMTTSDFTRMNGHFMSEHGISMGSSGDVICLWKGCQTKLKATSLYRHLVSKHLNCIFAPCSFECGKNFKRPDIRNRHSAKHCELNPETKACQRRMAREEKRLQIAKRKQALHRQSALRRKTSIKPGQANQRKPSRARAGHA
ncbi:hypothetical protein AMATHDRAFT_5791 [Amanita thiersii Skay4041]|uniref:C2H2-type domain-containing protein n=1 Tax=Amanita thiersii Skay4041 TaxID=703135 RepID=A0A2A9NL93_9AGAR|nr:hypothetical protein AMATHDRAFT_5791 [Amanita thiersii Skay4041]